ncbi:MAG TPA: type II toxin-antitoxin system VapC family toxin [Thermoanaerobaculia bacterium]|nr:type II toxin-antitoxin system VapC family toxin [Thermoanaerobaculia bacterium]
MILIDVNLLIYALDRDSPQHRKARQFLEETLSSSTPVGLAWIVVLAFLRVTTRSGIMRNPLLPERAVRYVDSWLERPNVSLVSPGERHWAILRNILRVSGTAGNLTSDAHLAALAIEHGYAIYSTDHDFRRFAGIEHVDPLR